ncbi:unnamed protein product [Acanthoscelides obtectus]|uniref:Uncharacterized protein n=1 Tax=Acanthoscelides obtectus TaxID=200917 RepID=A0A9P0PM50_ACAOB|nr:unnamed protein product [Acanthoscelides obtectus]CAK1629783.1 hypothetical protein AOBTE_LOCUS5953 [Acanthoscelides obtectus]
MAFTRQHQTPTSYLLSLVSFVKQIRNVANNKPQNFCFVQCSDFCFRRRIDRAREGHCGLKVHLLGILKQATKGRTVTLFCVPRQKRSSQNESIERDRQLRG